MHLGSRRYMCFQLLSVRRFPESGVGGKVQTTSRNIALVSLEGHGEMNALHIWNSFAFCFFVFGQRKNWLAVHFLTQRLDECAPNSSRWRIAPGPTAAAQTCVQRF